MGRGRGEQEKAGGKDLRQRQAREGDEIEERRDYIAPKGWAGIAK